MTKIFLSPSNQTKNIGAYIGTNEHEQCLKIAQAASVCLGKYAECEVMIADRTDTMQQRAINAKAFGADLYIAIHTNASSNLTAYGTETFYHSSDLRGHGFAEKLLHFGGSVSGLPRRCIAKDNLIEMNTPSMPRAYIEYDFHSNVEHAAFIQANTDKMGEAIAKCIVEYFILKLKPSVIVSTVDNATEIKYVVVRGDTLSKIAKTYKTTYQKLAAYNGIANPSIINIGQVIKIPCEVHVVVSGDTLWKLATKYLGFGLYYGKIKTLNGLTSNNLVVGQVLKIPTK